MDGKINRPRAYGPSRHWRPPCVRLNPSRLMTQMAVPEFITSSNGISLSTARACMNGAMAMVPRWGNILCTNSTINQVLKWIVARLDTGNLQNYAMKTCWWKWFQHDQCQTEIFRRIKQVCFEKKLTCKPGTGQHRNKSKKGVKKDIYVQIACRLFVANVIAKRW